MQLARGLEMLLKALQMAFATGLTVRRTKARYGDFAPDPLIQRTFIQPRALDFDYRYTGRSKQVVDVPSQGLFLAQMARNARLEIAPGRTGVNIKTRGEIENPEPTNTNAEGPRDPDHELIR